MKHEFFEQLICHVCVFYFIMLIVNSLYVVLLFCARDLLFRYVSIMTL
jgi:hypothetical protein